MKCCFSRLALRIALTVSMVIATIGIMATLFLVTHLSRDATIRFQEKGRTLSLLLSRLVAEGIAEENLDLVNRAAYILDEEHLVRICVFNEFWDRIEAYPSEFDYYHPAGSGLPEPMPRAAAFFARNPDAPFFDLSHEEAAHHIFFARVLYQPFRSGPAMASGFVAIHLDAAPLIQAKWEMFRLHLAMALLFCLATIVLLFLLLHHQVIAPVQRLRDAMDQFADGVAPPPLPVLINNEIGELNRQFSEMAQTIEERNRELKNSNRELARSNQDLEQFAYVASHDLQEPLRVIQGYIQLLEKRQSARLDDKGREYMAYIVAAGNRMKGLINDLLAYSRVDGKGKPAVECDLEQALNQALDNLRLLFADQDVEISRRPLPMVWADPGLMVQLLQNLVSNAVRYRHPDRPARIEISAKRRGPEWLIAVADNGIGINPRYFERIFKIFQRLHTREDYPGTGIGLAICKKIVSRCQGRIWVESTPGEGSVFHFSLPAEREGEADKPGSPIEKRG